MTELISPKENPEDVSLLKPVMETAFNQFDLPHRAMSTVTVVPSMFISWHDLSSYAEVEGKTTGDEMEKGIGKGKRQILNNLYGCANPGEILAIMGASGAGKTTLLNILTQKNLEGVNVKGTVQVNGLNITKQYMRKVSAYVQQDDCFIGSLTVEEHLLFNARLRMGKKYSKEEQKKRVHSVIRDLGLKESRNSLIGTRTRKGISGGEKKRLAFASEILTSPPILLCDEPTSGLDAFLAYQVISVLKRLAQNKGMTIVITIHQPSSQVFQLFDRIYLLAEGRVAFCGVPSEAEVLWKSVNRPLPLNFNPADHYLATLSVTKKSDRSRIAQICDAFSNSEYGRELAREVRDETRSRESSLSTQTFRRERRNGYEKTYKASWWQQLEMLTWRNSKTTLRETTLLRVQIMQSIIISTLTGLVYLGNTVTQDQVMNINGALFQLVTNMAFMFQYSSVYNICLEFPTFHREHGSNLYRVSTYFLAKNIAEIPAYSLCSLIFASIFYWMSGMVPVWDAFLIYLLAAMLVMNVAISVGYAFSCLCGSVPVAQTYLPIYVTPMFAFGGFFVNLDTLPIFFQPFRYLSHLRYGFEIVANGEWSHISYIPGCSSNSTHCLHDGSEVLSSMSFRQNSTWSDVSILVSLIVVIRLIAFVALFLRAKFKK